MIYKLYSKENHSLIEIYTDNYSKLELFLTDSFLPGYELVQKNNETKLFDKATDPLKSGCVLYDLSGKESHLKEVIQELKAKTNLPIIVLSSSGCVEQAVEAIKEGAYDFILINDASSHLSCSINNALKKSIHDLFCLKQKENRRRIYNSLTKREKEVISLVAQGLTNKAIGEILGISMKTVQQHRGIACQKLLIKSPVKIDEFLRSLK